MKKRKILYLLVICLISCLFTQSPAFKKNVQAKTYKKTGFYYVDGYNIKSIKITKKKIVIKTYKKSQMSYTDEDGYDYKTLKSKTFTFKKNKKIKNGISVKYYFSGKYKVINAKKLNKLIKKSKKQKESYELNQIYGNSPDDIYPQLQIYVTGGKVGGIIYYEGGYDSL